MADEPHDTGLTEFGRLYVSFVSSAVLGSPRALLRLQRVCILADCLAICLWITQVMLCTSISADKNSYYENVLVALAVVPLTLSCVLLPLLIRVERQCYRLVEAFEVRQRPIAAGMAHLFQAHNARLVRCVLICKALWYLFCIVWTAVTPPCDKFEELLLFWEQPLDAVPCEFFEGSCTLLLLVNSTLCFLAMMAPVAVERYRQEFTPESSRGLPRELLPNLPSYLFGEAGAPAITGEPSCTICISEFNEGEQVRALPCGHHYHAVCLDDWLVRTPVCPMRCHHDLFAATRNARRKPPNGSPSDSGVAPPTASSGASPLSADASTQGEDAESGARVEAHADSRDAHEGLESPALPSALPTDTIAAPTTIGVAVDVVAARPDQGD